MNLLQIKLTLWNWQRFFKLIFLHSHSDKWRHGEQEIREQIQAEQRMDKYEKELIEILKIKYGHWSESQ